MCCIILPLNASAFSCSGPEIQINTKSKVNVSVLKLLYDSSPVTDCLLSTQKKLHLCYPTSYYLQFTLPYNHSTLAFWLSDKTLNSIN